MDEQQPVLEVGEIKNAKGVIVKVYKHVRNYLEQIGNLEMAEIDLKTVLRNKIYFKVFLDTYRELRDKGEDGGIIVPENAEDTPCKKDEETMISNLEKNVEHQMKVRELIGLKAKLFTDEQIISTNFEFFKVISGMITQDITAIGVNNLLKMSLKIIEALREVPSDKIRAIGGSNLVKVKDLLFFEAIKDIHYKILEAVGGENLVKMKPRVVEAVGFLKDINQIKAIGGENLLKMNTNTIRAFRGFVPEKSFDSTCIKEFGGKNLVDKSPEFIRALSGLDLSQIQEVGAKNLINQTSQFIRALVKLEISKIKEVGGKNLVNKNVPFINALVKLDIEKIRAVGGKNLVKMNLEIIGAIGKLTIADIKEDLDALIKAITKADVLAVANEALLEF